MKRILVTGSEGFIGSYLMELIPEAIGFDLKSGQDIRDKQQLASYLKGIDVVVHLAAQTSIANAWDDPVNLYSHNILGTANVIEESIKAGVKKIVFASSASIYQPYDNPYSFSKYVCEGLFKTRKDEMQNILLRFMNVYGKGQNPSYGTVIPTFYKGIKKGKINIYGDGTNTRDYIHVTDVAYAIKKAVELDSSVKTTFMDIGTGIEVSVNKLAELFSKFMNKKTKIKYSPSRKERDLCVGDTERARNILGFKSIVKLEQGLKEIVKKGI